MSLFYNIKKLLKQQKNLGSLIRLFLPFNFAIAKLSGNIFFRGLILFHLASRLLPQKTRIFQCSEIPMLAPSRSAMFFETTIFSARLVSHGKNSSTKEASSSDGEESLSKIFSKKFCVLFCGSYSWSGLSLRSAKYVFE